MSEDKIKEAILLLAEQHNGKIYEMVNQLLCDHPNVIECESRFSGFSECTVCGLFQTKQWWEEELK